MKQMILAGLALVLAGCATLEPRNNATVNPAFTPAAATAFAAAVPAPVALSATDPFAPELVGIVGIDETTVALVYAARGDSRDGRIDSVMRVDRVDLTTGTVTAIGEGTQRFTAIATSPPAIADLEQSGNPDDEVDDNGPGFANVTVPRRWDLRWTVPASGGDGGLPVRLSVLYVGSEVQQVELTAEGHRYRLPDSAVTVRNGLDARLFRQLAATWWDGGTRLVFHNAVLDLETGGQTPLLDGVPSTFVDSTLRLPGNPHAVGVVFGELRVSRELAVLGLRD